MPVGVEVRACRLAERRGGVAAESTGGGEVTESWELKTLVAGVDLWACLAERLGGVAAESTRRGGLTES
jgi:hypothetical protein